MADNNQHSHNGQSPFRRYEPPTNPGVANSHVAPLTPPPLSSPGGGSTTTSRGAKRRQRQARSRWRQWLQADSSKAPPQSSRSPQSPSGAQGSPAARPRQSTATAAPAAPPRIKTPMPASAPPPPGYSSETSAYRPGSVPAAPTPGAAVAAPPPTRSQPRRPPRSRGKVTPIRRRPAWTSTDSAGSGTPPRRGKPRRSGRKAPRPVLYGIRLLILGTGIAAIAGTVLSSLNPGDDAALNNPNANSAAGTPRVLSGEEAVTQPLPLAEELVSVETDLVALESMTPGLTQSVFFYDLDTGNYIDLNGNETFAAASTIKVPILVAFLQAVDAGTVRLDQAVTLREELVAGGSGELQTQEIGTQFTALEVATAMIVTSDNTATNMVIELLGGLEVLNQQFRSWGLTSTTLRNRLPDLDGTNTTSAADLVRTMALIDQGDLLSPRSRDRLFSIMQRTVNRDLIPDGLADPTALAYNKTGDIGTLLGDLALVDVANGKRYVLSVLVDRPFNDGRASELIRRASGRVYEEMSQPVSPVGSGNPPAATTEDGPGDSSPGTEAEAPASDADSVETDPAIEDAPTPYVEPGAPLSSPELPPG